MSIVGTAGHVDHGKSTLVAALTGRDPDRWAEEKERGLTIDLGFAWTELEPGLTVGFVDVPGHERFIKNMLAGVGALDVAMFVVAADAGWMPQSEEHLAVLDLLEVRHGVIALTRVDLADEETHLLAELEIAEQVADTVMEDWPVVPVSPVTGTGLGDLVAALAAAVQAAGPSVDAGRPRLWVDRSFTIAGAGAVVTGTMTGGTLTRGQEVTLFPGATPLRIRNLQVHEHDVAAIGPGTRAAVNVTGSGIDAIVRGSMLGDVTQFRATRRALAELRTVRTLEAPLTGRGAYHLHVGSGSWPVDVRTVESVSVAGSGAVLVDLPEAIPLVMGDRYILRESGRRAVVGGGRILDPHPPRKVDTATLPRCARRGRITGRACAGPARVAWPRDPASSGGRQRRGGRDRLGGRGPWDRRLEGQRSAGRSPGVCCDLSAGEPAATGSPQGRTDRSGRGHGAVLEALASRSGRSR